MFMGGGGGGAGPPAPYIGVYISKHQPLAYIYVYLDKKVSDC